MIGRLRGIVDGFCGSDSIILDVAGVGYLVQCSPRTLQALPRPGEAASLAIETHVREDAIRLYGFRTDEERDWFRLLQSIQGVGAKVALAILGIGPVDDLASAIALGDKAAISRAPGVGPRLAARLVAELKDKIPVTGLVAPVAVGAIGEEPAAGAPVAVHDAISALANLGYARPQAAAAVATAAKELGATAEAPALIRRGLKALSSG